MVDNGELFENGWVNTNKNKQKWIRVDPDIGGLYRYNSDNGQYDIPLPISQDSVTGLVEALAGKADSEHAHPTLGDINFTGTVSADGDQGLTGQRTVGGYVLRFAKGLLVEFHPV